MKKLNNLVVLIVIFATFSASSNNAAKQALSFSQAIKTAQKNDPWLDGNRHQQQSLEFLSDAANTQPAPKVSLAFANLPTDGLSFSQEGMTQFKVGVSQTFARGDSLAIKNQQLQLASQQHPFQRENRKNKVAVTVGSLWLDLYRVQQSIHLIEQNRSLFEQLSQLAEASYSSGLGKTRQHDIVRAQLELTHLEDKLNQLELEKKRYQGMLKQWLSDYSFEKTATSEFASNSELAVINVEQKLPQLTLVNPAVLNDKKTINTKQLALMLASHPSLLAIDKKLASSSVGIELAKQKYQPQWGVNASYGYRADDNMGNSRADLFSLGVAFDMPLFTNKRQDNEVKSAVSKTELIKTEKLLLIRQLMSAFASAKGQLLRIIERKTLYQERLLPQIHDQAQAFLTAYTNDDGDFAEVVRSRIAELNAQVDFLAINVQQQKIILELNYLLLGSTMQPQRTKYYE